MWASRCSWNLKKDKTKNKSCFDLKRSKKFYYFSKNKLWIHYNIYYYNNVVYYSVRSVYLGRRG